MRKLTIAAIAFFTLKGLAWLVVLYLGWEIVK